MQLKESKNKPVHVAIVFSWRFECLNVMLDILKLNSDIDIVTHVFCNLNHSTYQKFKDQINHNNIDFFHHLPDQYCNQKIWHKMEVKRRQPLEFFSKIMNVMSMKSDVEKFIYTECDFFPMDIHKYTSQLDYINRGNFCGGKIILKDLISPKCPSGYLCMSPVYFYNDAEKINALINTLQTKKDMYFSSGVAFEGMVCDALLENNVEIFCVSNYFTSGYNHSKNFDPITMTTHQHNPLFLKSTLKKFNMTHGKYVEEILNKNKLIQAYDNTVFTLEDFENKLIEYQTKRLK